MQRACQIENIYHNTTHDHFRQNVLFICITWMGTANVLIALYILLKKICHDFAMHLLSYSGHLSTMHSKQSVRKILSVSVQVPRGQCTHSQIYAFCCIANWLGGQVLGLECMNHFHHHTHQTQMPQWSWRNSTIIFLLTQC